MSSIMLEDMESFSISLTTKNSINSVEKSTKKEESFHLCATELLLWLT